mmetsp:Transcript_13072/g.29658  ORF Transcript_13072/g.29658 Transcript_13072/m.29658 type:complete len:410 (-) Transcript_13072:4204-5433(-)
MVRPSQSALRPLLAVTSPTTPSLPKSSTNPGLLLLEGDAFAVSHDGIARTGYHLDHSFLDAYGLAARENESGSRSNSYVAAVPRFLTVEEQYDLARAHKRFILREQSWAHSRDIINQHQAPTILGKQAEGIAPMGDQLLGSVELQEIDEGTFGAAGTGATTWEASIAMGLFFASNPSLIYGDVLELGCGVGFGSILTRMGLMNSKESGNHESTQSSPGAENDRRIKSVTLTDGNELVLDQCRKNLRNNFGLMHSSTAQQRLPPYHVQQLRWDEAERMKQKYDTVIACDVAYLHSQIGDLARAMTYLVKESGRIHVVGPYNRSALLELCRVLQNDPNLDVCLQFIPMDRYRLKPRRQSKRLFKATRNWAYHAEDSYNSKATATFLWLEATPRTNKSSSTSRKANAIDSID